VGVNSDALAAQRRYARWLLVTSRIGAVLLTLSFVAYVAGWVKPYVPIERLPALWSLPASEFMRAIDLPQGWHGWAAHVLQGDMLVLAAIALLITSSILCLAAAIPVFRRNGERLMAILCVLQIAVLALAASGLLI
jgi:hypothetical protein